MHSKRVLRLFPFWNIRLLSANLLFFGRFSKGTKADVWLSKVANIRLSWISVQDDAFKVLYDLVNAIRNDAGKSGWSIMSAISLLKFSFHSKPCGLARKPWDWKVWRWANSCKVVIRKAYGFRSPFTVIWGLPFEFLGLKSPHFDFLPLTILKWTDDSASNFAGTWAKVGGTNFENVVIYCEIFSTESKINRKAFCITAQNKYYLYRREIHTKYRGLFSHARVGSKET